jgi:hypothetical protein
MKYGTILWSRRRRHSITQPLRVPTPPERCSIGMMDLRGTVNEITRFCQALLILKRIGKNARTDFDRRTLPDDIAHVVFAPAQR